MKGMVINSFLDFIEEKHGIGVLNELVKENSPLYDKDTYSDSMFMSHFTGSMKLLNVTSENMQYDFGEYFFKFLTQKYASYFNKSDVRSFLIYLDQYIHPEVMNNMEGAITPRFILEDHDNGFTLKYESERQMYHFALSLLKELLKFYNSNMTVTILKVDGNETIFDFHG